MCEKFEGVNKGCETVRSTTDLSINLMRFKMREILKTKSRNKVVIEIQDTGAKFHQYHIDRFLSHEDVKLSTLLKIDKYLNKTY